MPGIVNAYIIQHLLAFGSVQNHRDRSAGFRICQIAEAQAPEAAVGISRSHRRHRDGARPGIIKAVRGHKIEVGRLARIPATVFRAQEFRALGLTVGALCAA